MLAGAAALILAPKPALPFVHPAQAKALADPRPYVLHAGDRLSLNFHGLPAKPAAWTVELLSADSRKRGDMAMITTVYSGSDVGQFFVAPRNYVVASARVVVGGFVHSVPIEIKRSGE